MVDIDIRDFSLRYRNGKRTVDALAGLNLRVEAGSFTAVVGASGCGKTTLLRAIAGLQKPDAGSLRFGAPEETRRPRMGFMFQDARLLPWLSVWDNLALAFPENAVDGEEIRRNLALVGLDGCAAEKPDRLSGGMAQRVALARALCRKPEILLLDEPFGALDAITRKRLQAECASLWTGRGLTVVLVTHDIEEAVFLADRVAIMEAGRVRAEFGVDLPRPRDRHGERFQTIFREVEAELQT